MKLIKSSAIVLAISSLLAGPVLAQSTSTGTGMRGGMQSGGDEGTTAQPGAPGAKKAVHAKAGGKSTVGMSKTAAPADADSAGDSAPAGKR
jgi:hypothetical protein